MGVNDDGYNLEPAMLKVFETVPDRYLILSGGLVILTASNSYLQATHKTRNEITGKHLFEIFPLNSFIPQGIDLEIYFEKVTTERKPQELPVVRYDIIDPEDGLAKERYWKVSHTPVLNENGSVLYIIHHAADLTAQIIAEKQLKERVAKDASAIESSLKLSQRMINFMMQLPAEVAVFNGPDLVFEFVNPRYQQLFPNRILLGQPLLTVVPEIIEQPILKIMKDVYRTGEMFIGKEMCITLGTADGNSTEDHYFNFVHQARLDDDGNVTGILTFAYDITELVLARTRVENDGFALLELNQNLETANHEIQVTIEELRATNDELHATEQALQRLNAELEERVASRTVELLEVQAEVERQRERLESFFMQSPAGICVLDGPELVFELINPPYQQLFPGRDLLGKKMLDAVPEIEGQPIWNILQHVYQTGETFTGDALLIPLAKNDQSPVEDRYFNFIYQARLNANGRVDGILVFVFEVTNMVMAEKKVEISEKRFGFLLNAMPQQVWTAKPDGTIDYINDVICDDLNITEANMFSERWYEYVHPDDRLACRKKWQHALDTGDDYMVEVRLKMQDNQYKWHLGRAIPLIEDGQVKLWVGTNTNIDFQKDNEQKKDEFLSIASHELKTPLTSIKAFNQLMKRTNDLKKVGTFVKKSEQNIHRLERLIADLLDVTKINAGKMIYNMQEFNFREMLLESIENVQHTSSSHQLILEHADEVIYTGDRFRIEQVINNFLTNAIKYSPKADKVIVRCIVELNNIVLSVEDFGIGIASHDLNRLFERYYRGDNTAMRFEGLGLGLFISSEILKRHEGSFWIESELEKGSTFYFRLPLNITADVMPLIDPGRFYQDETITIGLNQQQLEVDWRGFHNLESVQQGCRRIQDILIRNKITKIRNDNRNVLGTWSEAAEWVGQEWMPLMEKEGLRYIAWINSPSSFSRLSAEKALDVAIGGIITRLFPDISSAQEWLDSL